jgi:hypothetical protein
MVFALSNVAYIFLLIFSKTCSFLRNFVINTHTHIYIYIYGISKSECKSRFGVRLGNLLTVQTALGTRRLVGLQGTLAPVTGSLNNYTGGGGGQEDVQSKHGERITLWADSYSLSR